MRYILALDGIRAVAVAAVVLYHLRLPWMQGGVMGVTMFFVISGFIITRLLLHELDQAGRIDFRGFYLRRARRLLPAILALVPAVVVLCALFNHVMLTKMRPDILPSLLFFNNWWQVLHNVSYFGNLGDPSPLTHFWSLAIEEQFYLVWPVLLFGLHRMGLARPRLQRVALALALVSAGAMFVLYSPAADPTRLYYGTDTRAFSLLLGVWLACAPTSALDGAEGVWARRIDIAGAVGLAGLLLLFVFTNGYAAFPYRGGMVLCSVLTLALIAACVREGSPFSRVFSARPLTWMGTRSYGIYLWHYPLLLLMNPVADVSVKPWWVTVLQLAVVFAVAEASYRFVETPFRRGAFGTLLAALREERGEEVRASHGAGRDVVLESEGDVGSSDEAGRSRFEGVRALLATARRRCLALSPRFRIPLAGYTALVLVSVLCLVAIPDASALSEQGAALLEEGSASSEDAAPPFLEDAYDIVMIGDSVSVRTVPAFEELFPHGKIDAQVNRQFAAGIELLRQYVDSGQVGGVVVIALGTNGLVTDEAVDEMVQTAGANRRVVFMTTRSPQPWVAATNDALARATERHKNVRVVDWFAYSEGRNELFDGDGTHLTAAAAKEYIQLVYDEVKNLLPARDGVVAGEDTVAGKVRQAGDAAVNAVIECALSSFAAKSA